MMFSVLLKEWLVLSQAPTHSPEHGAYGETLYAAKRVDFHPPGRIAEDIGLVVLSGVGDGEDVSIDMTANRTVFVMNGSGKTVATYHGTLPPRVAQAQADRDNVAARSSELRWSDIEAAARAQVPQ